MEKRFGALRIIAGLYKIAAFVIGFGAIVVGGFNAITPSLDYNAVSGTFERGAPNTIGGLIQIGVGIMIAIGAFAFGQLIDLFLALEENTRETAFYMSKMRGGQKPKPVPEAAGKGMRALIGSDGES